MKLVLFDRKKYIESLYKLKVRKAPSYVIKAYNEGYTLVVNEYYKEKLNKKRRSTVVKENKNFLADAIEFSKACNLDLLNEALAVKDLDFIKAFFKMANLDLTSGDRLPPNASKLIKQRVAKDFGLKDLYKKLR